MTNKVSTPNKYLLKPNFIDFAEKPTLLSPLFFGPQSFNFVSNILEKKNSNGKSLNNFAFNKTGIDFDNFGHALLPGQSKYIRFPIFGPMKLQSKFQFNMFNDKGGNNNMIYEPQNLILNKYENEQTKNDLEQKDETKIINQYNENNCSYLFNFLNYHYNFKKSNLTPDKNINLNLNMNMNLNTPNNNNINNSGTKFFTNHNYGYKCSCSKTQCNRKYCECFKNGQKCSSLCRCISCENNDKINNKKTINNNYECCPANSIFIIKNNIIIESVNNEKYIDKKFKNNFDFCAMPACQEFLAICKKRKREENKNNEDNCQKMTKNTNDTEDIDLFNDSLFDKNGKVILRHINLIHM